MSGVFLCHATRDGAGHVQALAGALEAAGRRCWYAPRDIVGGRAYAGQIVAAIRACDALVVFATDGACVSADVLQELQVAQNEKKLIIPITFAGVTLSDDLQYYLAARHQLTWRGAEATSPQIFAALGAAAKRPEAPRPKTSTTSAPGRSEPKRSAPKTRAQPPADAIIGRWRFEGFDDNVTRCAPTTFDFRPDCEIVVAEPAGGVSLITGSWSLNGNNVRVEIDPPPSSATGGAVPDNWALRLDAKLEDARMHGSYLLKVDPEKNATGMFDKIFSMTGAAAPRPVETSTGVFSAVRL